MKCRSGNHEWLDQIDADRCCDPTWQRITILPGERMSDVLDDPLVARDGINYSMDGFKFAWLRIFGQAASLEGKGQEKEGGLT
jgi:hypothetical protein